ncbi:MAG: hypothetical protein EZS26_002754 [Candidatus Ordinivivax streblomastigis]|uniref:DUF5703 domain-containing protein n=1 Tax=Candidatus Ordinivivax streblomastigis TaxID=2540710 RepID=A0A5M8NW99_9BACT|nr:MAG: hypothetical protein EZS26_002754 [Candidatus Ordinivivax streblomastigis]
MKKYSFFLVLIALQTVTLTAQRISDYNVIWDTLSHNSSESMPCGGGDIGLNVWTEGGDVLFYFSRSGFFDENNTLLKPGRIRIRLTPNPFEGASFRQELKLEEGHVVINGKEKDLSSAIRIWVDVFNPVIHVDIANSQKLKAEVFYENWRYQDRLLRKGESHQNSYKELVPSGLNTAKDEIGFESNRVMFFHRNPKETVIDATVEQQGLESVKHQIYNPLENLIFGGVLEATGFKPAGTFSGKYADTDYQAWKLESVSPQKNYAITIQLHAAQTPNANEWEQAFDKPLKSDFKKNLAWWKSFWDRSFIHIQHNDKAGKGYELARNYQLFRYMLGCNAYGQSPTKFNGGLFTFDPGYIKNTSAFTPDYRAWGGGTHTAQNQRLVYFPMLKSGDTDMMKPQFDFYKNILYTGELRSKVYWGHGGVCFTEQIDNFGLPQFFEYEYGGKRPEYYDKGQEYSTSLEYLWDTVLEFCFMMLEKERYTGADISEYIPLIESSLRFFDEHYQYLAKQRGINVFDEQGKLILYPGSACETYKMTYNSTSTISALQTVASRLLELPAPYLDSDKRTYYEQFLKRLPEIRTRDINGHTVIAPAWHWERVGNVESPQLYPVFPWGIYGIGKPGLETAINTFRYDPNVVKFRNHISWHQDAIFAARLGLTEDAKEWTIKKLQDSGRRFPAFWGPGHDWTPDHNWGGSGMIALQEMLLQTDGGRLLLLPAWPKEWDVRFKLHAPYNTTVECVVEGGIIKRLDVTPKSREKDVIMPESLSKI